MISDSGDDTNGKASSLLCGDKLALDVVVGLKLLELLDWLELFDLLLFGPQTLTHGTFRRVQYSQGSSWEV